MAQRDRMVLAAAEGMPNDAIARRLHVTRQTVGRWRAGFPRQAFRRAARRTAARRAADDHGRRW
jgi:hypothetical protein